MSRIIAEHSANKYILLDLIGTGGMAEVFRCKLVGHQGFEKLVVLKKLLPDAARDSDLVTNFIDEARLAAFLQHDNIAHIYDFGELHGTFYIAMEYLFGKDLHTVMRQARALHHSLGVEQALFVAAKICEGMDYAHKLKDLQQRPLNIIHRDLTPHNVFITYDGKVKIIDFGIAKAELYDHRTKVGVVKGKISYMSPEQLMDDKIDSRSDIFSIGILLYEMLSGKRMYTGDTASLIRKCMAVEYTPLEEIVTELHPEIYTILHKALQREKGARYQSCLEMKRDIEECLFNLKIRPDSQMLEKYILHLFQEEYEGEKKSLAKLKDDLAGAGEPVDGDPDRYERTVVEEISFDSYCERTEELAVQPGGRFEVLINDLQDMGARFIEKPWARSWKCWGLVLGIFFTVVILSFMGSNRQVAGTPDPAAQALLQGNPLSAPHSPEEPQLQDQMKASANEILGEFVTTKETIDSLLTEAQQSLEDTRLTTPAGDCAYFYYMKVLELDPDNNVAGDGIRRIGEKYAELAESSLAERKIGGARAYISKGLAVSPQNPRLFQLQGRLENIRKKEIAGLAAKAEQAMRNNKLTTPYAASAYRYYQDILEIEKNNRTARAGLVKIGDRYAAMGEKAYSNMKFEQARVYVQKGLKVSPRHSRLLGLKRDLAGSEPELFLRGLEKKLGTLFE